MINNVGDAISRIAERTVNNYAQLKTDKTQRRVTFADNYGIEFVRQGDASNPATFYISISPDFIYYERFALKLQIMPYISSVSGINVSGMTIGSTELTLGGGGAVSIISGTSTADVSGANSLTPNPHTHNAAGGSGGISYGLNFIHTTSTTWSIYVGGVDVSAYLMAQQDGNWIDGEDIYPTNRLDTMADYYDILAVACDKNAEGEIDDVEALLKPEMKKIEIFSDAPFQVAAMVYLKYSQMNR